VDLEYKGCKIHAYKLEWKELDNKGREVTKREYYCRLYRNDKWLNLGEMSDGSKFTAVAQAVNEAKWLVDYHLEQKLDSELLSMGFLREDLFKFNKYRITERLEMKEELLLDEELLELKKLEMKERESLRLEGNLSLFLSILERYLK
jgi:hypothetical protein